MFCRSVRSFFQSVCVLGYCVLPLAIALIVCQLVLLVQQSALLFSVRCMIVLLAFGWSTFGEFCTVFIVRQHTDARYWYSNSVRPSVRDVPVSDENGLMYCHSFSPYGSPIILALPASNIFTKFRRGHPCGVAKYRWGIKISRFSTNKSLYLTNDTRYRHSHYGRRIGTRMRSIKWCHFPMTLNEP